MVTQTIQAVASVGFTTPQLQLRDPDDDTAVGSPQNATAGSDGSLYSAAFTDVSAGLYRVTLLSGGDVVASGWVDLTLTTATFPVRSERVEPASVTAIAFQVWEEILTGATHNVPNSAGRILRGVRNFGDYSGGYIWIDTVDGTAGTVEYENGTVANPVDSIADAITLSNSLNIKRLRIATGSSITLSQPLAGKILDGDNYLLNLNGQDITNTIIKQFGPVTGTATASAPAVFDGGPFGSVTLPPFLGIGVGLSSTLTLGSAGNYLIVNSHSEVAGTSAPTIDCNNPTSALNLSLRRWSGGLNLINVNSNCTVSIDAVSGGTISIAGADGNVQVRGMVSVTDNRTGTPTLGKNQVLNIAEISNEMDDVLLNYFETQTRAAGSRSILKVLNLLQAALTGTSSQPSATTERFNYPDATEAFTATFDNDGNRQSVSVP